MNFWDDEWQRIIENILEGRFSGGYISNRRTDYGEKEEGVIYADTKKEILEFDDKITITIDLHGVRDEDLNIKTEEDGLNISYMCNGVWDNIPILLPSSINRDTIKTSFNNFILDIQFEKVKE